MAYINLIKLCVGAQSIEDLQHWQEAHASSWPAGCAVHTTRMWPKRENELLSGGSLYWVIKGVIQARQTIVGLDKIESGDGITRCAILLDKEIIRTQMLARRPFQGWRYLTPEDSPKDVSKGRPVEETLPPALAKGLSELGLI